VNFNDLVSYSGKRVVVTGAASGMGAATIKYLASLDAEIFALDRNPVEDGAWTFISTDLSKQASIDAAVEQITSGDVHGLFNVAGLPGGRGIEALTMLVNFYGHRHLTEQLIPSMPRGAAIVNVTSLGGFRYYLAHDALMPMLEVPDFESAEVWLEEHPEMFNGYGTSKEVTNLWTTRMAKEYAENHGIRINCVAPGTTDTPLLDDFKANAINRMGTDAGVVFAQGFFGRFSHAEDQAAACVFINSDAASMISGQILGVDGGMAGSMLGGILPIPEPRTRD
jgi:NAD(P)-dependent dehydrogenase (short-subunit alcohol dehydrogenase family)